MLVFIRHGETDFNKQGLWMGCTDIELNATGLTQAADAAKELATKKIDVIYTSPLKRAYKTAKVIAAQQSIPPTIIILDDFKERGFGILEGTPRNQPLDDDFDQIKGVESKKTLVKRLTHGLATIEANKNRIKLIVSHGAVFHCLIHDMGYTSSLDKNMVQIGNCQPIEITAPIALNNL